MRASAEILHLLPEQPRHVLIGTVPFSAGWDPVIHTPGSLRVATAACASRSERPTYVTEVYLPLPDGTFNSSRKGGSMKGSLRLWPTLATSGSTRRVGQRGLLDNQADPLAPETDAKETVSTNPPWTLKHGLRCRQPSLGRPFQQHYPTTTIWMQMCACWMQCRLRIRTVASVPHFPNEDWRLKPHSGRNQRRCSRVR